MATISTMGGEWMRDPFDQTEVEHRGQGFCKDVHGVIKYVNVVEVNRDIL